MREAQTALGSDGPRSPWLSAGVSLGRVSARNQTKTAKRLGWTIALAIGALGLVQVYHAQLSSGFDLFPGPRGDTRLSAYLVEHGYQALLGHAHWLSPGMFYPIKGTLGFSDLYLAYVPLYSLFRLSGLDIFLALSLTVIVLSYLNFIACFALLNKVFHYGVFASCAAAMFFAFNNPKLAQPDHLQLQPVLLLPIIVALVFRFFAEAETLSAKKAFGILAFAALCLNLQLLTSFYIGWFFGFWGLLFLLASLSLPPSREFIVNAVRRQWYPVVGGLIVFVVALLPFLVIYVPAVLSVGGYGILPQYIPETKSYLLMADGNYIWDSVTAAILAQAGAGPDWGRRIGIGLVPSVAWIAMSMVSLFWLQQSRKRQKSQNLGHVGREDEPNRSAYLFLGLMILTTNVLVMIGWQYRGHSLWNYAQLFLPGAQAIRAVARYAIVLTLPMAIAFAYILQRGVQAMTRRRSLLGQISLAAVIAGVTIFGLFEQLNSGVGRNYSISGENMRLKKLAAKLPEDCTAFYIAAGTARTYDQDGFEYQQYMHDAMLISEIRHVPTLNGRSGKSPPGWSLRNIRAPDYELNVKRWIAQHKIEGNVCRLEIDS